MRYFSFLNIFLLLLSYINKHILYNKNKQVEGTEEEEVEERSLRVASLGAFVEALRGIHISCSSPSASSDSRLLLLAKLLHLKVYMATRTFSVVKSFISNSCYSITRRGVAYAAASRELGHLSSGPRPNERSIRARESDNSWGPDPVTGFYRPVNGAADMDVADLRNMLLKNRIKAN